MTLTDALQRALAVEHQVVYGYGVVGGRTTGVLHRWAHAALVAHERRRDALIGYLTALHEQPTPAAPAYELPFAVRDELAAARLGAQLENASARVLWDLVAAADARTSVRRNAVGWLAMTTLWLDQWRSMSQQSSPVALPGQPA